MRKHILKSAVLILLLFVYGGILAQNNNGLLFEIRGNGLKKPSYIFGSFLMSSKYKYAIDNKLLKYMDACEGISTEVDLIKGFRELADSNGINDYCFRLMSYLYSSSFNEVKLPNFATNNEADAVLFSMISAGGSTLAQLENEYAKRFGMQAGIDKAKWPNYNVMQYAIRKNIPYSGLQPIDSMVYAYADFIKLHENLFQKITKSLKDVPEDQQKSLMNLIPEYMAGGKAENLFSLLKHLKNGTDTLILQILNVRTQYLATTLNERMQKESTFAAVNWLTLTNPEGLLQQFRKMGYSVKAIKMKTDAENTFNSIKALPYSTTFSKVKSDDGMIEFLFPGQATNIQIGPNSNSWIHYDMVNKSSFTVSRIKHNYSFKGQSMEFIRAKVDSMLYEKVPGVMEKKEKIENELYTGFDIVSVTRNDDYIRIKIYITPFEFIVVKCDGDKRFAVQADANKYFEGFQLNTDMLKSNSSDPELNTVFYHAHVPGPAVGFNKPNFYFSFYESNNTATNTDMILMKGAYQNMEFIDEDTFLMNSCISAFTQNLNLKETKHTYAQNMVTADFSGDDSRFYKVRAIHSGINYCIVATSSGDSTGKSVMKFFDSYEIKNENLYPKFFEYKDTALRFTVTTIDIAYQEPHSRITSLLNKIDGISKKYKYNETSKTHAFFSACTGETINVEYAKYLDYTYFRDSVEFWNMLLHENMGAYYEFKVSRMKREKTSDLQSITFLLTDTNSSMGIKCRALLKGTVLFLVSAELDTVKEESKFVSTFYQTFKPTDDTIFNGSIFEQRIDNYLTDLISTDSATVAKALKFSPYYSFTKKHLARLQDMLKNIPAKKEETETEEIKNRIMDILSIITDSASTDFLKQWYANAGDTSELQMHLLITMARHKTPYAFTTIKELLNENPPASKNWGQIYSLFSSMEDSARLAATYAPDLLNLLSNEDFKEAYLGFIGYLADSNYLLPKKYEQKLPDLLIQAKNELKRQANKDAKDDQSTTSNYLLISYCKALQPFYSENEEAKSFLDKCLQSTDLDLRESVAIIMAKHNKPVVDSIWESLSKNDLQRYSLIQDLSTYNRLNKLPAAYRSQEQYARAAAASWAITDKTKYKAEDIVYLSKRKIYFHQQWGYVYLYKIKSESYDYESTESKPDWKLCLSGMQPSDTTIAKLENNLTYFSRDNVVDETKTIEEQFDKMVRQIVNYRRHIKYKLPSLSSDSEESDYAGDY